MKKWYLSKTIWVAVLQAIAGVVMALTQVYPEVGYLMIVKSLADISLRYVTEQGIK